jgi:hypothetical protein
MTPPLFTQRSPFGFVPMWHWLHAETCRKGSFIALPVDRQPWPAEIEWFEVKSPEPPAQAELFQGSAS